MNITKLQQNIKEAEEALSRMKQELEDAERMDSKDYYPENGYISFNVDNCIKAIDGLKHKLDFAFYWKSTPQGHEYWYNIRYGKTPLSDGDKITLLRWCVNYYRSKNS